MSCERASEWERHEAKEAEEWRNDLKLGTYKMHQQHPPQQTIPKFHRFNCYTSQRSTQMSVSYQLHWDRHELHTQ